MWEYKTDGSQRKWVTEIEWSDDVTSSAWLARKVITVKKTEILIQQEVKGPCLPHQEHDMDTCTREELVMRILCLSEEINGKFRVQEDHYG